MRLLPSSRFCILVIAVWSAFDVAGADQGDPRLPALFEELRATGDGEKGAQIGLRIAQIWNESGKDRIDEVMRQGKRFMDQGKLRLALSNFTTVTRLEPRFAEGWNKRAAVLYRLGDFDASEKNAKHALALEPRHFLALAGLGVIHLRRANLKEALRAFDAALEINPHLSVTRGVAERLRKRLQDR